MFLDFLRKKCPTTFTSNRASVEYMYQKNGNHLTIALNSALTLLAVSPRQVLALARK
jgi:hypothetical protein